MKINKLSGITFGQIGFHKSKDRFIFDDFICKDRNNHDCFVTSENDCLNDFMETVKIYEGNNKNITLAENKIHCYNAVRKIYNDDMKTLSKSNYKNGYGTIMHLCSIMELLENNLDEIIFGSYKSAVYFHSKMKFEPCIKELKEINIHLQKDIVDKQLPDELQIFAQKAKINLNDKTAPTEELIKSGNKLLYNFIQTVRNKGLDREKYGLFDGFTMHITKESILQNKEFFNNLFKTFHIDYLIK